MTTDRLVLGGATLIDGTGAEPVRGRWVVVEGGRIAAATDGAGPPGARVIDEGHHAGLHHQRQLGHHRAVRVARRAGVITAATSAGARLLGLEGEIGRIAPGLIADLLAVEGHPAERVEALDAVRLVVRRAAVDRLRT